MVAVVEFINQWLAPAGVVLGLITAVPIFWTWWQVVFGEPRRLRRWHREAREHIGLRPAILIIDLLPGRNIAAQAQHFIAQHEALKHIPKDRHFSLERDKPLTPEAMPDLLTELRAVSARISHAGCDTIHCFYAGPVAAAACIGAEFANGARLHLYQHQNGTYTDYGPLRLIV
jgi:hypothetical protein